MKKKLGEILVASGAVTREDIDAALSDQSSGEPARLGDLLVALGKISPLQLALALSQQYGISFTELPAVPAAVLDAVPLDFQRQFRFVPIKLDGQVLSVALADLSQAATDVLPRLKKQFSRVNLFVAAGDEIDAVHAALSGEYESGAPVQLPQIAPVIAPVTSRSTPAPTADELFGSLELDDPLPTSLEPMLATGFELDVPEDAPTAPAPAPAARSATAEEEPFFFEASPVAAPPPEAELDVAMDDAQPALPASTDFSFDDSGPDFSEFGALAPPAIAPVTQLAPSEDVALDALDDVEVAEPVEQAELLQAAEGLAPPPENHDPVPFEEGLADQAWAAAEAVAGEPLPEIIPGEDAADFFDAPLADPVTLQEAPAPELGGEDVAFFDEAPAGEPMVPVMDDAFVPGVPSSSPSSLAQLIIEPDVPVVPSVPPVKLPPVSLSPVPVERSVAPAPAVPDEPPQADIPDWLKEAAGPEAPVGWTGALDHLAPSKLILAVTRALLKRGVLTEQDILDADAKK